MQRGDLVLATDTVLGNALGNYEVIQTWTAEDACGNNTMHERVIQVVDTIAPEVVFLRTTPWLQCRGASDGTRDFGQLRNDLLDLRGRNHTRPM